MKPSKIELDGNKSSVLVVPDHEQGIFVVDVERHAGVKYIVGRSVLVVNVDLDDAVKLEEGESTPLQSYIRHSASETGLIVADGDVWLRRERDGSGHMSGYDRIRRMKEYSPNPGPS